MAEEKKRSSSVLVKERTASLNTSMKAIEQDASGGPVDPRLLFSVPKFRDVKSDLDSLGCLKKMTEGTQCFFFVVPALKKKSALTKVHHGVVALDPFNRSILLTPLHKPHKHSLLIEVASFKEVRVSEPPTFLAFKERKKLPEHHVNSGLGLFFGESMLELSILYLVFEDEKERIHWTVGLNALTQAALSSHLDSTERWLKTRFLDLDQADVFYVVRDLFSALHMTGPQRKLTVKYLLANHIIDKKGQKNFLKENFTFFEFLTLYRQLEHRAELKLIFLRLILSEESDGVALPKKFSQIAALVAFKKLSLARFRRFLIEEQGYDESIDAAALNAILSANEPDEESRARGYLTYLGFQNFITSLDTLAYNPAYLQKYTDFKEPLSHYFINSSHNTYLTGHQLTGVSSVEMYIQVLLSGCRCIEIDTWDGPNGEPMVTHGNTLTTTIRFVDVVHAIRTYAFVTTSYPLIISIEQHCSLPQQDFMASTLKSVLGDFLIDQSETEKTTWERVSPNLPSPEVLKRKVLIKHKKRESTRVDNTAGSVTSLAAQLDGKNEMEAPGADEEIDHADELRVDEMVQVKKLSKQGLSESRHEPTKSGKDISEKMSELVIYTESVRFVSFLNSKTTQRCSQLSSFSERKGIAICKKYSKAFAIHNMRQLSRIYPYGLRVDSSNYSPLPFWFAGCQLVSLNFQTNDDWLRLNTAMFERNGGTGYILKPRCLRFMKDCSSIFEGGPINGVCEESLEIEVISAQHVHAKVKSGASSVIVSTIGLPSDSKHVQTRKASGRHPIWKKEVFLFEKLRLPEMVFVKFELRCGEQTAYRIIPYDALRPGYRHVHLRDENGSTYPLMTLFIRVKKTSHGLVHQSSVPLLRSDSNTSLNKIPK